jgi:nucleoside-diphosphate-sugar epimerase
VESRDIWRRAARRCDAIVHLAAPVHQTSLDPRVLHEVTVSGTGNAAAFARETGARFLLVSSVGVYGTPSPPRCDERTPVRPETPYAKAKIAAEDRARHELDRSIVLRSAVVYGPGDRGNVARLISAIYRGRGVVVGSGRNRKSLVFSHNLAERIMRCVSAQDFDGTWCVADAPAPTQRELADTIARQLGRGTPRSIPVPLAALASATLDVFGSALARRPLSRWRSTLRSLTAPTEIDGSALDRQLNYAPDIDLKQGIRLTVAAMGAS